MRVVHAWLPIVCVLGASACSGSDAAIDAAPRSDSSTTSDGGDVFACTVVPPTSCTDPSLRYADVAPIIEARCVGCHSGETDQWALFNYSHVADWFDIIPPQLRDCSMPPPEEKIPMSDEERVLILTWYLCGFPE